MEILRLTPDNIQAVAQKAAEILAAGGIIAYPTDTVYGLGVNALDREAIERLRLLKGRERKRPLSVIVPTVEHISVCGVVSEIAHDIAKQHLPGPLTLVIPAHSHLPEELTLNGGIGVRVPNHDFCLALAHSFGHPYTSTSANKAQMSTPKTAEELIWHFGPDVAQIDLIIDAGELSNELPSTVLLCIDDNPRIVRHGVLSPEDLGLSAS